MLEKIMNGKDAIFNSNLRMEDPPGAQRQRLGGQELHNQQVREGQYMTFNDGDGWRSRETTD